MTCRHSPNDSSCSSYVPPEGKIRLLQEQITEQRKLLKGPDNSDFEIVDLFETERGLVLKVRYESCLNCSYEGTKVLVYFGHSLKDVLKWKTIDPHFSDRPPGPRCAPSPSARFPASEQGWLHATMFAAGKDDSFERHRTCL